MNKSSQPVTSVESLAWKCGNQHCEHVATMRLVMRVAKRVDDSVGKGRFQQSATILPSPLVNGQRSYAQFCQFVSEPQSVENA